MRRAASVLALLCLTSASVCLAGPFGLGGGKNKPNKFEASEVTSPEAIRANARKYWKAQGLGKIREAGFTKVAITEFNVEFVAMEKSDWSGKGNFGLLDVAQMASGAGRKKFEFTEEFKTSLPRRLHDSFAAQLTAQGYEVKSLEAVTGSDAFARYTGRDKLDKNKKSGSYHTQKSLVYPAEGLMDLKSGAFSVIGNANAEAALIAELGVDVSLHVQVKVGIWKNDTPAIERDSVIQVFAGVSDYKMPSGETRYSIAKTGTVIAKDGFFYEADVVGETGRKGTYKVKDVDEALFEQYLMEMYAPYMGMAVAMIDDSQ